MNIEADTQKDSSLNFEAEDDITAAFSRPEHRNILSPEMEAKMEAAAEQIVKDLDFIKTSNKELSAQKGYGDNWGQGYDGSPNRSFTKDNFYCAIRYENGTEKPVSLSVYSSENNSILYYKITPEGQKIRINEHDYAMLEAEVTGKNFSGNIVNLFTTMHNQGNVYDLISKLKKYNKP